MDYSTLIGVSFDTRDGTCSVQGGVPPVVTRPRQESCTSRSVM
jgi:hypothetical protein